MKITLFFFFLLMTSPFTYSQWMRTNGPEGISMCSLLTVGDTVYAGTKTDGVYASTNDGVNWFAVNSGIENQDVEALGYKEGYLYAGTNGNGVYRSTNGGQTWLPPANANNLFINSILVKDSYVFAAAVGVYRSSDNGVTWEYVGFNSYIYETLCAAGNKIFAGAEFSLFVTTNYGENWSQVNSVYGGNVWSLYCNGNFVIVGDVNRVFISTDQGNNFTPVDIPFEVTVVNIYDIKAIGNTLFAATSWDGVYKSTDMGFTWTPAKTGMGPKNVRALTVTGSSSLIAGAHYAGVFRSTNAGSNWSRSMSGLPAGSTVTGLTAKGSTVLAGTYDGVFRSTDDGLNWNKLTGDNDTVNYSLVRGIWTGGSGLILQATNYHYHSTIYRSTDNGMTWKWSGNGITGSSFINSITRSGNNILAASERGVYYSSDEGKDWVLGNGLNNHYVNSVANDRGGGYVFAEAYFEMYVSGDDGINWSLVLGGYTFTSYMGARGNYACAGTSGAGALVTTDNGNLWSSALGLYGVHSVYGTFYVPNTNGMVLASTDNDVNRIYISSDNGLSFLPYSEGLGMNALAEAFTATDSFLIAGMDYNGIWRRLRPDIVTSISNQNDVPKTYNLEQNYPNPFNPETKINYSLPKAGFVSLKIYDMLGREVSVLVDEVRQPGKYSVVWNAGKFASGIYFYKLTSGQFTSTKKMILIK